METNNVSENIQRESMIRAMIKVYQKDEENKIIGADLTDFSVPPQVNGHIPDIVVKTSDSYVLLEAETCNSIDKDETKLQLTTLHNYATQNNIRFDMVIPKSCLDKVNKKLSELNISAKIWSAANL